MAAILTRPQYVNEQFKGMETTAETDVPVIKTMKKIAVRNGHARPILNIPLSFEIYRDRFGPVRRDDATILNANRSSRISSIGLTFGRVMPSTSKQIA